eukprot:1219419-Amorphochlora_amoeboformis.AAC.1
MLNPGPIEQVVKNQHFDEAHDVSQDDDTSFEDSGLMNSTDMGAPTENRSSKVTELTREEPQKTETEQKVFGSLEYTTNLDITPNPCLTGRISEEGRKRMASRYPNCIRKCDTCNLSRCIF